MVVLNMEQVFLDFMMIFGQQMEKCRVCATLISIQIQTRKPVGFMQSCCFVFNGNETKTCLLCNSYLFGMNNVL